jgi:hypothetical protein
MRRCDGRVRTPFRGVARSLVRTIAGQRTPQSTARDPLAHEDRAGGEPRRNSSRVVAALVVLPAHPGPHQRLWLPSPKTRLLRRSMALTLFSNAGPRTRLSTLPAQLAKSLTSNRGKEMCAHTQFKVGTGTPVFFADPQSPWQRGTNENTNCLLR